VHVGARVMSEAGPNEVLVSGTVRELMAGSDIRFEDRGIHELKGVQAQQHLFSARPTMEQEPAPTHPALLAKEAAPPRRRSTRALVVGGLSVGAVIALLAFLLPGVLGGGSAAAPTPAGMALMDAKTWHRLAFIPHAKVRTPLE